MTITRDQIVEEIAELPVDVSAELVERILIRRHGGLTLTSRKRGRLKFLRISEIKEGRVKGIPLDEPRKAQNSRKESGRFNRQVHSYFVSFVNFVVNIPSSSQSYRTD